MNTLKKEELKNGNNKSKIKIILSIIVLIITLSLIFVYIYTHISDFKQLKIANPYFIIILVLLVLITSFFTALLNKILLEPLNAKITLAESFALSIVTGFYNYIMPFRGGMIIRGVT